MRKGRVKTGAKHTNERGEAKHMGRGGFIAFWGTGGNQKKVELVKANASGGEKAQRVFVAAQCFGGRKKKHGGKRGWGLETQEADL